MRPASRMARRRAAGVWSWPCAAPADVEMLSLMSVPPKSLAPHERSHCAWRIPSFTQETWRLRMVLPEHQARDGVEADDVVARGTRAQLGQLLPERHRRLFVHERERARTR